MLQKAKVKETGEIIFVRPPYRDEYFTSLYEPDYVRIDENYKYAYDIEELELID